MAALRRVVHLVSMPFFWVQNDYQVATVHQNLELGTREVGNFLTCCAEHFCNAKFVIQNMKKGRINFFSIHFTVVCTWLLCMETLKVSAWIFYTMTKTRPSHHSYISVPVLLQRSRKYLLQESLLSRKVCKPTKQYVTSSIPHQRRAFFASGANILAFLFDWKLILTSLTR